MGDISKNFSRYEFSCSCNCGFEAVDIELVAIAEKIRKKIGAFTPISVCRCLTYNRLIGSKDDSQHVNGMAMDVLIFDDELRTSVYKWLHEKILSGRGGIGTYPTFLHFDLRKNMARWKKL